MKTIETTFKSAGKQIAARIRLADSVLQTGLPAIVINHGYSGDKQEYDEMAKNLCECGFVTLQFDSRGCGESEAQKGRMMCSTEWMEDAASAVSFISALGCVDSQRIGYSGCSMGGAVALCSAASDPRIKCVVAMSPMTDGPAVLKTNFDKNKGAGQYEAFVTEIFLDAEQTAAGKDSRYVSVPYALALNDQDEREYTAFRRAHPDMVESVPLESVLNSFVLFRPVVAAHSIKAPVLILHGSADEIVNPLHSLELMQVLQCKKERIVIKGAPHPLPVCDQAEEVFAHTVRWFKQNL